MRDQGDRPLPGFARDDPLAAARDLIEDMVRHKSSVGLSQHAGRRSYDGS